MFRSPRTLPINWQHSVCEALTRKGDGYTEKSVSKGQVDWLLVCRALVEAAGDGPLESSFLKAGGKKLRDESLFVFLASTLRRSARFSSSH
jgi:hypothetical protein